MDLCKGKWLITTDKWFTAPDGLQYLAVWGSVKILNDSEVFGIKTNRGSSNWFALVGKNGKEIIVAGCQIHYVARCNKKPNTDNVSDWTADSANGFKEYKRPTKIYLAE